MKRSLSRFRVIDCRTRRIIPAAYDISYVALSYQWGDSSNTFEEMTEGKLPCILPLTIEDSIKATLGVGLQYLWVDAYCITQTDEDDFKHQIRQMDLIYRCAYITLIAAAGTGADSGLPGISKPRRRSQAKGSFHRLHLATFSPRPWDAVLQSNWSTRGWTFQESFFSRRRLFFTEDEALLDCYQSTVAESLVNVHVEETEISKWYPSIPDSQIYKLIEEYSKRGLTYPSDILNAFEGVSQAFDTRESAIKAYWGLPLLRRDSGYSTGFLLALCWFPAYYVHQPRRRQGFPSWSWTGWLDDIYYNFQLAPNTTVNVPQETKVHIEIGEIRAAIESIFLFESKVSLASQKFFISALSLKVMLRERVYSNARRTSLGEGMLYEERCQQYSTEVLLRLNDERTEGQAHLNCRFHDLEPMDSDTYPDTRMCFAIYLLSGSRLCHHYADGETYALLLVSRKERHWERVGLWFPSFPSKVDGADFEDWLRKSPDFQIRQFCIG